MDVRKLSRDERWLVRVRAEQILRSGGASAEGARKVLADLNLLEEAEARVVRSLPMAKRVVKAFRLVPAKPAETRLLKVLLDHPGCTSAELSRALGSDGQDWHLHFGEMCKRRQQLLADTEPLASADANFYCCLLADIAADGSWTMKADVVIGLVELKKGATRSPRRGGLRSTTGGRRGVRKLVQRVERLTEELERTVDVQRRQAIQQELCMLNRQLKKLSVSEGTPDDGMPQSYRDRVVAAREASSRTSGLNRRPAFVQGGAPGSGRRK